jgi:hypothetical protein
MFRELVKGFKKNFKDKNLCSNWPQNPLLSPLTAQMRWRCRYPTFPKAACKWMTEMPSVSHRHSAKCLQCSDSSKKQIFGRRVGYFFLGGSGVCWQIIYTILAYYSIDLHTGYFRRTGGSDSASVGDCERKNVRMNTRLLPNSYRHMAIYLQTQEHREW